MHLLIHCEKCGQDFTPSEEEIHFIARAALKGMTAIVIHCTNCPGAVTYNPSERRVADPPRKPDGKRRGKLRDLQLRCPTSGCSGWVFLADEAALSPFYLCGECGQSWDSDNELDAAIEQ